MLSGRDQGLFGRDANTEVQNGQENCRVARDLVHDIELFVGRKVE
jgi:hypothetical protein